MGRQNAIELASRGADLVINYANSAPAAYNVIEEIRALRRQAIAVKADMSRSADVVSLLNETMEHYGHIDIVVSNSGVESFGHISEVTPEEFDRVFAVNTRGQLLVAQQAYKHLTPGDRLIMLSPISAQAKSVRNHSVYSSIKCAVEAFVRCLAVDMGDKKITVNAIAPGGIKTDMYTEVARKYIPGSENWSDEKVDEVASSWYPLGRPGVPRDISRAVAFLSSEDGSWMNGQVVTLGGGAAM